MQAIFSHATLSIDESHTLGGKPNGSSISLTQPYREVYFAQEDNQLYVIEGHIPAEKV
jgi:hypothetical protein